jgi:hypothetical protein
LADLTEYESVLLDELRTAAGEIELLLAF